MEELIQERRIAAANYVIGILFGIGLILSLLHLAEYFVPGFAAHRANDLFGIIIHPTTAGLLFAAFLIGTCLSVFVGSKVGVLALLPLLLTSFLPMIGSKKMRLPTPAGAIIMTLEESCPEGWTSVPRFKGRMPIGFDAEADRPLQSDGGQDEITLETENLPPHDHSFSSSEVFNKGNLGHKARPGGFLFGTPGGDYIVVKQSKSYQTKSSFSATPLKHLPPYLVVNFCRIDR